MAFFADGLEAVVFFNISNVDLDRWKVCCWKDVASINIRNFQQRTLSIIQMELQQMTESQWFVFLYDSFNAHISSDRMEYVVRLEATIFGLVKCYWKSAISIAWRHTQDLPSRFLELDGLEVWSTTVDIYKCFLIAKNVSPCFKRLFYDHLIPE